MSGPSAQVVAAGGGAGLIGLRVLLIFGIVLLLVAVIGWLRQTWRRRATAQEEGLPELLGAPDDPGTVLAAPLRGAYLGTTDAGQWLEWFSARGLSGKDGAYITVHDGGVRVDRGSSSFWIPREAVRGARLERAHAGKVAAPGRLLVIAWSLDGRELETGFRGEDRARQPKVMRSVHDLIGPPVRARDGEVTSPRPVPRSLRQLRPRRHQPVGAEGAEGVPAAPRGRPHGSRQASGRGGGPRRRGSSRTLEQEIADRRGADPYGTGPRSTVKAGADVYRTGPRAASAATGIDPYVTGPRGASFGSGAAPSPGVSAPGAGGRRGQRPQPDRPRPAEAPGQDDARPRPGGGQPDAGWRPAQGPGRATTPGAGPAGQPPARPAAAPRPPAGGARPPAPQRPAAPRPPAAAPPRPAAAPPRPGAAPPRPAAGQRPPAGAGAYGEPAEDGFSVSRTGGQPVGGPPWPDDGGRPVETWPGADIRPGGASPRGPRPAVDPVAGGYDPYDPARPTPAQAYPAPAAPPPDPYEPRPSRPYPTGWRDPSADAPADPYAPAGGYPGQGAPPARDLGVPAERPAAPDPYAAGGWPGGPAPEGEPDPYDDTTRYWPRRDQ